MVQNQLKAETQIMSLLWKAEDSGDDRSNWHTYPDSEREAEHEVREQNPPSIVPHLCPLPSAYWKVLPMFRESCTFNYSP